MRPPPTPLTKRPRKINRTIKPQAPIPLYINIQCLEIRWCIQDANLPGLDKVICDHDMFLIGRDFDIVRADGRLDLIWVIETFDRGEIRDVEGGDVVRCREREVGVVAVGGDVGTREVVSS
jgi:hypothetical protein